MEFLDYEGLKLYDENIKKFISAIDILDPINPDDFQSKIKGTGIAFVINDQTYTSPEFTYGENGFQTPHVRLPHGTQNLIELFDPELGSVPIITNKSQEFHFHGQADSVPYTGLTGCNVAGKILVSTGSSWELQSLGNVALDPNAYLPLSGGQMHGTIDFMDNGGDQNLLTLEEACPLFSINRDTSTLSINGLGSFNTVKIGSSIHASKFMINDYCGMYHNGDKLIIDSYDNVEITAQSLFVNNISSNGFFVLKPDESSYGNNYVILAGGGVKPLSELTPDLSEYVTSSGVTDIYVGEGLYLSNLDDKFPSSLTSITTEGRITLKLGYPDQSDYSSSVDDLVENRQYGVGLDAGGKLSVNVPWTDNNTTYTFTSGTNGFKVTPSGGTTQTVTVTPSITNNITGSGTSGCLAKFNGTNTLTSGPKFGSDTTKFLRNDGEWEVPTGTGVTGNYLRLDGGEMSGDIHMCGNNITFDEDYICKIYEDSGQLCLNSDEGVNLIGSVTSTGSISAPAFFETSDIRKKNIKADLPLDKCYELIDKCQTVIYSLKDQTKEQVGMIAQEIEEFFPEVVATDEEGFKSLAYDRLVVICFKVLKDVIKRLEKLETK